MLSEVAAPMVGVQPVLELGGFVEWPSAHATRGVASEASVPVPWIAPAAPMARASVPP